MNQDDIKKLTSQRWSRDPSTEQSTYRFESEISPTRFSEEIEFLENGTYREFCISEVDSLLAVEGTWGTDDDGLILLSKTRNFSAERKLRFDSVNGRLIVELPGNNNVKVFIFDLGNTLESNDKLLDGATEVLQFIYQLKIDSFLIKLALLSDWKMPNDEVELKVFVDEYFQLLKALEIDKYFTPLETHVTLSTEMGVFKPDPTLFRAAIDKLARDLPFENVFFVTENKAHVNAAASLGIKAIHFKGPNQSFGDIDKLSDLLPMIEQFIGSN